MGREMAKISVNWIKNVLMSVVNTYAVYLYQNQYIDRELTAPDTNYI